MARKPKRFNLPKAFKIRNLILLAILIIIVWNLFGWLCSFVASSPYFKIEKVEILLIGRVPLADKTVKELLSAHRGKNIFDVNLKSTRDYILANYPDIRTLVINRVFPNKLVLTIRPRRPVVQASLASGFCLIDGEGVPLPGIKGLAQIDLPIISGIDSRVLLSSVGKRCESQGLRRALRLLELVNQMKFSQEHEIHMIDVSDEKNLSLYIEGGIEIRIGAEDFRNRLVMLKKTFETGRLDKSQIKYIDLRFGNVVIGPR